MNFGLIEKSFNEQVGFIRSKVQYIIGRHWTYVSTHGFGSYENAEKFADWALNNAGSEHHIDVAFGWKHGTTDDYLTKHDYDYNQGVLRDREQRINAAVDSVGINPSPVDLLKAISNASFAITGRGSEVTDMALKAPDGFTEMLYEQNKDDLYVR